MSFILDALRKSEHDRQRQATPGFADIRTGRARSGLPVWALALAGLLLVNIVVMLLLVVGNAPARTEPSSTAGTQAPVTQPAPAATPAPVPQAMQPANATGGSAQMPAVPPAPPPAAPEQAHVDRGAEPAGTQATEPPAPVAARTPLPRSPVTDEPEILEPLPTMDDLMAQGRLSIPEIHLDIHVYATRPAERFVFLNMRKYREGAQTPEGVVVEHITRDGVVLNHRGVRFLLPRQ